jgi:hypothetical protein
MNEIDFDELVNALELLIQKYAGEIGPYSVALCNRMIAAFIRMSENDENEESSIAATECLGAIQASDNLKLRVILSSSKDCVDHSLFNFEVTRIVSST